ncbi:MAG: N5-carboxyaminoimidazole ribonucleotide mutase [Phycisphaerae bacterium]|nr:N5-carboxyaminoimidazole ribonucleotide mutase [Phycisphaerae bacterium]
MEKTLVAIVMGSDSDWEVMEGCLAQLQELEVAAEVNVLSAHRSPQDLVQYIESAVERGVAVFIAAAGMSAALAGTIAAHTTRPVIGVPMESGPLQGLDALLSTVQMPPGVPVAAMAIGSSGAKNAALYAAQILALSQPELAGRLVHFKAEQTVKVRKKNQELQKKLKK